MLLIRVRDFTTTISECVLYGTAQRVPSGIEQLTSWYGSRVRENIVYVIAPPQLLPAPAVHP